MNYLCSPSTRYKDERTLFVTYVSNLGPYLCISGQLNPEAAKSLGAKLLPLMPTCFKIEANWTLERKTAVVKSATVCVYKPTRAEDPMDVELLRARILNTFVQHIQRGPFDAAETFVQVEVEFMDYGHSAVVDCHELFFPKNPALFQHTAPYCQRFIMLGVCAQWMCHQIDEIKHMIVHQTLNITIEKEIDAYKLVTIQWKDFDFAEFLIHQKKMGAAINNSLLYQNFANFLQEMALQSDGGGVPYINNNSITSSPIGGTVASPGIAAQLSAQRSLDQRLFRQQKAGHQATNDGALAKNGITSTTPVGQPTASPQKVSSDTTDLSPRASPKKPNTAAVNSNIPTAGNGAVVKEVPAYYYRSSIATFKSSSLNEGGSYDVSVSYVENGPQNFKVQLLSAQGDLTKMMNRIENARLRPLVGPPIVGMACIARYTEDKQLYRALIIGVLPPKCKVIYIDYGDTETLGTDALYEIPEEFVKPPLFAMRFCLSRLKELGTIDDAIKNAFKELVMLKDFQLQVKPFEGTLPIEQYCELYMQGVNVLDILKEMQKRRTVYQKPHSLVNGEDVEIRYIFSPKKFYVQRKTHSPTFEKLMEDMFLFYNKNQVVPTNLTLGMPCVVKDKNEWFRAEVVRPDGSAILVRHVDYGFEQKVTVNLISNIADKHLKLPRQAILCCLKGFEDKDLIRDTSTAQFEMLAEDRDETRRTFKVKIFGITPDGVNIVNLTTSQINVMQILFKYSFPFAQYLAFEKESFPKGLHQNGTYKAISDGQMPVASSNEFSVERNKDFKESQEQQQGHESSKEPQQKQQQQRYDSSNEQQQWRQQRYEPSKAPQQKLQKSAARIGNSQQISSGRQLFVTETEKPNAVSSWDDENSVRSNEQKRGGKRTEQYQSQMKKGQGAVQKNPYKSPDTLSVGSANSGGSYNKNHPSNAGNGMRSQRSNPDNENRRYNKQPDTSPRHQQQQRGQRSQNPPQGYVQPHSRSSSQRSDDVKSDWSSNDGFAPSRALRHSERYVPLNQPFPVKEIDVPGSDEVLISWWISPHQFYIQSKTCLASLDRLTNDMQVFYKNKPLQQLQLKVGSSVIMRDRKTNTMQRARVLACNHMLRKYKVFLVDHGKYSAATSEDVWQVEQRFAELPCMAYLCALPNIISNFDHCYVIERMTKYLPADATLICIYHKREGDKYYADVNVDDVPLKKTLLSDGVITEVSPDFRLNLLAKQQIRAKISSIKDMLNFKINFEGCDEHIKLLCSYDDVRFVKSNPDMTPKFKQFYEGKSCMVNIKEIDDNKVVLLRPTLPLLKEDIPTYICTYPIVLQKFVATVVFVASPYRVYVQSKAIQDDINALLDNMYEHYEKNEEKLSCFEIGQICAAKSVDGSWYRARIAPFDGQPNNESLNVFYLDYGNNEIVSKTQLKRLDEMFYVNRSAYAIEINLPLSAEQLKHIDVDTVMTATLEKEFTVQAIEVHGNHLIADLLIDSKKSVLDLLLGKQLIKGGSVDAMRKMLNKDKPNIIEYMEMVDLTLEEEEENDRNQANKSKVASTPIKKKAEQTAGVQKEIPKAAEKVLAPMRSEPEIVQERPATATPVSIETFEKSIELTSSTLEAENTIDELTDAYAHMEKASLSHCDNPAQFFLHTMDKLEEVSELQENLQIVASSLPPLMNIVNGAHCISLYSVDKQWYRAKIMDAELLALKFIDYGNTDCVTDASDIKEMSVFPNKAPLCTPCALPIKPNGTADWLDAANNIFTDSFNKMLYFEYLTSVDRHDPEKPYFINLYIDDINVAEKLIQDGFARPLESVISGENCYISHGHSPAEFYIQYEKDAKALELIELYLHDNELPKVQKFEQLKTVAAFFPEDQMFYRAKMLKEVPGEGITVFFIDYGNTCVTTECREMSEEIANLPSLSKKCSLELPQGCTDWGEAAEYKFVEMSACGETIFTVELREPTAEGAIVDLFIDGHNIIDDLKPHCVHNANLDDSVEPAVYEDNVIHQIDPILNNSPISLSNSSKEIHTLISTLDSVYKKGVLYDCTISHSNALHELFIQFEEDAASLEKVTDALVFLTLPVPLAERKAGQLCAAIFRDDGFFYRALFLEALPLKIEKPKSEYRMFFVDYGNTSISDDLRELPEDLKLLKPLCTRVRWANTHLYEHSMNLASKCFEKYLVDCAGSMKVEILDDKSNPVVVKLYDTTTKEELSTVLDRLLNTEGDTDIVIMPSTEKEANTCVITHINSPLEFYVQLQANFACLEMVSKMLSKQNAEQWPLVKNIIVNTIGSVYVALEDCYYRGRVVGVLAADKGYEVKLIDYGNIVVASELRQLPEELCINIPSLAFKCKLIGLPHAEADVLEQKFLELIESHFGAVCQIISHDFDDTKSVHAVKLNCNGIDLSEKLSKMVSPNAIEDVGDNKQANVVEQLPNNVSNGAKDMRSEHEMMSTITTGADLGEQVSSALGSLNIDTEFDEKVARVMDVVGHNDTALADNQLELEPCSVYHVYSPYSFYILLNKDIAALDFINNVLNEKELGPLNALPKVGTNCVALSKKHNAYYRAVVVQALGNDKYEVQFTDYGNFDTTDQLRELPASVAEIPPFCKHCSLDLNCNIDEEGEMFTAIMSGLLDMTFHVSFVDKTKYPMKCNLYYNGVALANELLEALMGVNEERVVEQTIKIRRKEQRRGKIRIIQELVEKGERLE